MREDMKKNISLVIEQLEKRLAERGIAMNLSAISALLPYAPEEIQKLLAQSSLWLSDPFAFFLGLKPIQIEENSACFRLGGERLGTTALLNPILAYSGEKLVKSLIEKHIPPGKMQFKLETQSAEYLNTWSEGEVEIFLEWPSAEIEAFLTSLMQNQLAKQEFICVALDAKKQHIARLTYAVCVTHQSLLT